MNNFIVSARKYRPANFNSVVGQESITSTLKNSIKLNHLAHAYLFCGPRGVGKTTCARIFAKTINCQNITDDFEACNECESCKAFEKSNSFNIHELDAASNNSVDDIRNLIDQVRIPPQIGKYSIYIIDEVHMLSQQAFNAFLKTLEEPPEHAIFILATTEKHKIIPTILSRCQIFDFKRIKVKDITAHLKYVAQSEGIKADDNALHIIAEKADGALRDALSIFDQIVSFSGSEITYASVIENLNVLDYKTYFMLTDNFIENNIHQALLQFDEILNRGFNITYFINGLSEHLRNLLVCKDTITLDLLDVSENQKELFTDYAKKISSKFILQALEILNQIDINYKSSTNKRLFVEIALMKLCSITNTESVNEKNNVKLMQPQKTADTPKPKQEVQQTQATTSVKNTPQKNIAAKEQQTSTETVNEPVEKLQSPEKNNETKQKPHEPKPVDAPPVIDGSLGNLLKSTQSLSDNSKTENIDKTETNELNNNFTIDDFNNAWIKLLQKYDNRIKVVLEEKHFDIENKKITINVKSDNTQKDVNGLRDEILKFLFNELQNTKITLETKLLKSEEIKEKRPYTNEEKYKYMANKNKTLTDLKLKFDLDV